MEVASKWKQKTKFVRKIKNPEEKEIGRKKWKGTQLGILDKIVSIGWLEGVRSSLQYTLSTLLQALLFYFDEKVTFLSARLVSVQQSTRSYFPVHCKLSTRFCQNLKYFCLSVPFLTLPLLSFPHSLFSSTLSLFTFFRIDFPSFFSLFYNK